MGHVGKACSRRAHTARCARTFSLAPMSVSYSPSQLATSSSALVFFLRSTASTSRWFFCIPSSLNVSCSRSCSIAFSSSAKLLASASICRAFCDPSARSVMAACVSTPSNSARARASASAIEPACRARSRRSELSCCFRLCRSLPAFSSRACTSLKYSLVEFSSSTVVESRCRTVPCSSASVASSPCAPAEDVVSSCCSAEAPAASAAAARSSASAASPHSSASPCIVASRHCTKPADSEAPTT